MTNKQSESCGFVVSDMSTMQLFLDYAKAKVISSKIEAKPDGLNVLAEISIPWNKPTEGETTCNA